MRLVCRLSNLKQLKEAAPFIDAVLLDDKKDIEVDIESVHLLNLIPIYNLSEMIFPTKIEEYKSKINRTKHTGCLYYITDLGLAHILKDMELIHRTIYDPITMITNHLDAKMYQDYGFAAIGLSNEITISDTINIINQAKIKAFLQVFGYRGMLHTRRRLISLYQQKIDSIFPINQLTIEEATRKEKFPIVETETGTKIYRGYILCLLKELSSLSLEYAYLDSFGINEEIFLEILKLFDRVIKGNTKEEALKALELLNLPIEDGFAYQDSVYMKEEF